MKKNKNKKLTSEMRALEKQRKAEQYRERELAKTEVEAEALEVTVKVEQPKKFKEKKINKYLKKQKKWQKQQENKKKTKERKKKKTPVDTTPVEKPVAEPTPIDVKPPKPEPKPTPVEPTPIDVKPPKPTPTAWDAKEILEMMESVEKGLEDLKKQIEGDGITNYKGGSNNRYVEAANAVYDNIGSAQTKLKRAKDIIDRFTKLNVALDDDTVGEKALNEINEQWTVLSEWKEVMVYSLYEADEDNKTIIGTGLDAMEEKVTDLDDLASAIDKIAYSISRGARSQGLKI